MKKRIMIFVLSAILSVSAFSCGNTADYKTTGNSSVSGDENISQISRYNDLIGSTEEIDYNEIVNTSAFASFAEDFTSDVNPLQIKNTPFDQIQAVKPIKAVFVKDGEVIAPLNIWRFFIVSEGKYVGAVSADCREGFPAARNYSSSASFADCLNSQNEDFAIFMANDYFYGIRRDNSIFCLESYAPKYEGELRFEDVNQEYNLFTSDNINNVIFSGNAQELQKSWDDAVNEMKNEKAVL